MSESIQRGKELPVDREDLQRARESIQDAYAVLDEALATLIETIANEEAPDAENLDEALEQSEELTVQANSLREDLKKLKAQQSPTS